MTKPRKNLISIDDTPYYHCVSRCVRRAYLCGNDGEFDFEHRRGWILAGIKQLASVFAIDISAFAVMSNHYHLVLFIDRDKAVHWTDREVIDQWRLLFKCPAIIERFMATPDLSSAELALVDEIITDWRERLHSISWFMQCLNQSIARMANREDGCTGRFWEGRFKSQALLDEVALLTCMTYVDLNPVRAAMADTPESSDYTSIQARLGIEPTTATRQEVANNNETELVDAEHPLQAFAGDEHINNSSHHLPFHFVDYVELVDWTGRQLRDDKRGALSDTLPPILERLGITPTQWLRSAGHVEQHFYRAIGPIAKLEQLCDKLNQHWLQGTRACRELYGTATVSSS